MRRRNWTPVDEARKALKYLAMKVEARAVVGLLCGPRFELRLLMRREKRTAKKIKEKKGEKKRRKKRSYQPFHHCPFIGPK